MNAIDVRYNQRVLVVKGEYIGRKGHVITLPIPLHPGVVVLADNEKAFVVSEAYIEPEQVDTPEHEEA